MLRLRAREKKSSTVIPHEKSLILRARKICVIVEDVVGGWRWKEKGGE
jgi:hypothetical protein